MLDVLLGTVYECCFARYQSLGGVERTKWHHTSDGLIMEAEMGAFCEGLGHYKSVFQFECSKTKVITPVFCYRFYSFF